MENLLSFILFIFSFFYGGQTELPTVSPVPDAQLAEVVSVIDGDTIIVNVDGTQETVRYIGIDTPEPYRDGEPACFSAQATKRNTQLLADAQVTLVADTEDRDRYDRLLRYVYADDVFVNHVLVAEGFATTLSIRPNTQQAARFAAAQTEAQEAKLGLWSACAEGSSSEVLEQTQTDPAEPVVVEATHMTDGQRRLLKRFGIDADTFVFTLDMIRCAETAVGEQRLQEITAGDTPSVLEGAALARCYVNL